MVLLAFFKKNKEKEGQGMFWLANPSTLLQESLGARSVPGVSPKMGGV